MSKTRKKIFGKKRTVEGRGRYCSSGWPRAADGTKTRMTNPDGGKNPQIRRVSWGKGSTKERTIIWTQESSFRTKKKKEKKEEKAKNKSAQEPSLTGVPRIPKSKKKKRKPLKKEKEGPQEGKEKKKNPAGSQKKEIQESQQDSGARGRGGVVRGKKGVTSTSGGELLEKNLGVAERPRKRRIEGECAPTGTGKQKY